MYLKHEGQGSFIPSIQRVAVRDLASGYQLLWQPLREASATEAAQALTGTGKPTPLMHTTPGDGGQFVIDGGPNWAAWAFRAGRRTMRLRQQYLTQSHP
jgi:hypothetical protein